MKLVRALVREEIKKLMNDDALFSQRDIPGLESERDDLDMMPLPSGMPSSCPICGTDHEGPCHNPARKGGRGSSYMAKPQLYRIVKNATEIFNMIEDDEEISDWMESYISQADQMLDAIHGKLEYKNSPAYHKKKLGPVFRHDD